MPYRTFFCYANSTQEAEEWIKMLQWKLVCSESYCLGIPWEQLSNKMGRVFLFWHKLLSGTFNVCARYKSMFKIGQHSKPEHRVHSCLRHGQEFQNVLK